MFKKNKQNKLKQNILLYNLVVFLVCAVIGIAITNLILLVIAFAFSKASSINNNLMAYFITVEALGGFVCSIVSQRKTNIKGIVVGIITGLIYTFLIYIEILFFVKNSVCSLSLIIVPINLLFCIIGGIVGANMKRRK